MKDKLKESVSALIDNEADELELRRILAQSHDEEIVDVWRRYHQVRASLNNEEAAWVGVDLREGINSALDEIDGNSGQAEEPVKAFSDTPAETHSKQTDLSRRWWSGVAIAASVAFVVVFSVQFGDVRQNEQVVENVPVEPAEQLVVDSDLSVPEFSSEHEARLNEYLMRHTGHAALNSGKSAAPFARLTSFEPEQE